MGHLYLAGQWPHKYYLEHWQNFGRAVAELHGFSDISVWSGSAAASMSTPLEQLCIVRTKPAHLLLGWPRTWVQLCGLSSTHHKNLYFEYSVSLFPPLLQWRKVRARPTICHFSLQDKITFFQKQQWTLCPLQVPVSFQRVLACHLSSLLVKESHGWQKNIYPQMPHFE